MSVPVFVIDDMTLDDIAEVQEVEQASFTAPWPANAFRHELLQNKNARYIVARDRGRIVGYAGLWNAVGEAHITTFAVHPDARRRGVGRRLLLRIFELTEAIAKEIGTSVALTLEVRISNLAAQRLYEHFGFRRAGIRRRYYSDNEEDALIMWTDTIDDPALRARVAKIRDKSDE
ncbi:MAG: ribosomal-protein-alanine N-acetyltransferase [Chloroflexi bacterium]|nr:ribosomal-protein-alanine N-acetyltransferase [Chloroflexota bacterium]